MKKKVISLFIATVMFCLSLPSAAVFAGEDPNSYHLLNSTFNTSAVFNAPEYEASLTLQKRTMIQVVTTYHWNYGQGAAPGYIAILKDGVEDGRWYASGRGGSGASNVYWDAYPNYIMEPGYSYTIVDSDHSTWSWNDDAQFGFVELRGYVVGGPDDPGTGIPQSPVITAAPASTGGYHCSDWARSEIENAKALGLLPSSLANADLTQPINRRDFAAISATVYENMSGNSVSVGSNPFTDTNDAEVLKAYAAGIVNGMSDTTFEPNSSLTREQAATMLTRAYKKTVFAGWSLDSDATFGLSYDIGQGFSDSSDISSYARESVDYMSSKGVINGTDNNRFDPKNSVTREQAIAIAVRMMSKLDTSAQTPVQNPQNTDKPQQGDIIWLDDGSGVAGPAANNTLAFNDMTVSFGSGAAGGAALLNNVNNITAKDVDSDIYTLCLTDTPTDDITISVTMPEPEADCNYRLDLGIPVITEDGEAETVLWYGVDAEYKGGKAVSTFMLNNIPEVIGSTEFAEGMSFKDYMNETAKRAVFWNYLGNISDFSAAVNRGVTLAYCKIVKEYEITSPNGYFVLRIPKSFVNDDKDAANYFVLADATRMLEDMESILSDYDETYGIIKNRYRKKWPMDVYLDDLSWDPLAVLFANGCAGYFTQPVANLGGSSGVTPLDYSYMKLNQSYLTYGYKKNNSYKYQRTEEVYSTLSHELFHFVQRCYASQKTSSKWFDESSGVYYAAAYLDKVKGEEELDYSEVDDSYNAGWIVQYQILPNDIQPPTSSQKIDAAYCRMPVISYLMKKDPKALGRIYRYMKDNGFIGTALTSWQELFLSVTGHENMAELARDYFEHLVVKGDLYAKGNKPWEIYENIMDFNRKDYAWAGIGRGYIISFGMDLLIDMHPYTASFYALDAGSINTEESSSFNIELDEKMSAVLMEIKGNDYSSITVRRSSDGKLQNIPAGKRKYLLMLIDEGGEKRLSELKLTLNDRTDPTDNPLPFRDDDDIRITDVPTVSAP